MTYFRRILSLLFVVFPLALSAQRVGLVLSGGGAKGLYHIGVIRALEENGIPIDYVSGTSMGAIIGGLYAAGYSPEEMTEIFLSDQVTAWMSGRIDDRYIYYFRQPEPTASMVNLLFDPESARRTSGPRFQLPSNLISSRRIDLAFVEFFSAPEALCEGDFDKLFVPFRCVATDGQARREVVYRSGNLGRAIRASMTLPLVFRPLRQDSTLLYDGGIYNNFPWQTLQEDFAPDILIGSTCVANSRLDENNLVEQVSSLMMMHTDYTLPGAQDILIEHVFEDVTTLDFAKAEYVINRGYSDAIDAMPVIRERIARRVDTAQVAARRQAFRDAEAPLAFDSCEINGLNVPQTKYVERLLGMDPDLNGRDTFGFDEFEADYFKMLSTGDIESDYPEVEYTDSSDRFGLTLNLRTRPNFKVMLGGNISSTSMNQFYLGLQYKRIGRMAQTYRFDGYLSALYSSAQLGERIDFFLNRPLAFEYSLNYNYYNYFRSDFGGLGAKNDLFYNKTSDFFLTTALIFPTTRLTRMSVRANLGRNGFRYYNTPQYTDDDKTDRTRFLYTGVEAEFSRNNLNYTMYPTRGIRQSISAIFVYGRENYYPGTTAAGMAREWHDRAWFGGRFTREHYYSIGPWFSAGYLIDAVLTDQPAFANASVTNPVVPAFTPTPHSHLVYLEDFRSRTFLGVGVMPTFEFNPRFYLKNSVYAYLPDDITETKGSVRKRLRYIFSSTLVYQTPIGAASLSVSKYDATSNHNWFLMFNFGYTIFNRKGTFY